MDLGLDGFNEDPLVNFRLVALKDIIRGLSEALHGTTVSVRQRALKLDESRGKSRPPKKGWCVRLTDTGQDVAKYAWRIFATGQELVEMVRGGASGRLNDLRVGILEVMPKLVAFRFLQPTLTAAGPIRLVCDEGNLRELSPIKGVGSLLRSLLGNILCLRPFRVTT